LITFIEFGSVTRRLTEHMDDEEYRALQNLLLADPLAGVLIPGTGGVRKLRWAGSGRGKRGGLRVIYYFAVRHSAFLILHVYAKGEQEDLRPEQKRALKALLAPYQ
jgi:mRNA-degrading endonuclease RelE of RelBE toxin-antitoxin system